MVLCQIAVLSEPGVKVCAQTNIQTYTHTFSTGFCKNICPTQHLLELFWVFVFVLFCLDILALERTRFEVRDVVSNAVFTITSCTQ